MIDLQHVTKTYAKNSKKAVDDLTLKVEGGELFGFIGPNGAGKTTTIKMMTGVLQPDEGTITMAGHRMDSERLEAQRMIGFVPDGNDLYDRLTGMEYLNFMADIFGVSAEDRKRRGEKYLEIFEMTQAAGDRISSYSRGMKQKIASIGALIHNPPIWVLDEPMVGLDPRAAFLLKEEMKRRAAEGATVFFSTHVLEVAEKMCDKVGIINQGKLIMEGSPEDLIARRGDASLEELFLELTEKDQESPKEEDERK